MYHCHCGSFGSYTNGCVLLYVVTRCYEAEPAQLRREVCHCITSVVRVAGAAAAASGSVGLHVCLTLIQLQASDSEPDVVSGAAAASAALASALAAPNLLGLYAANARDIIATFAKSEPEWTKHSAPRAGFDALLRVAPAVWRSCPEYWRVVL